MEVSDKHFLLQGPDIGVQEMKPMLLVFDLVHVDISRWYVLVSTLESGILQNQTAFVQSLDISLMAGVNQMEMKHSFPILCGLPAIGDSKSDEPCLIHLTTFRRTHTRPPIRQQICG